jgi:hypothetical protein
MAISASAATATAVAVASSLSSPSLRYRAMDALLRLRNNPGILDSSSRGGAQFCLLGPTVEETTLSLSNQSLRYLPIVLEGRFKGVWGRKQHRFTLAATGDTKALANQKWLRRMVRARGSGGAGPMADPLFCRRQDHPTPIRVAELDKLFHRYLLVVPEESPELIGPNVDVEQDYSSRRSIRRGATTHALNRWIPAEVVDANNHWRKAERAGNRDPSLAMPQVYTDAAGSVQLNIWFSMSL